jgi:Cysteine-rich secretory protein family
MILRLTVALCFAFIAVRERSRRRMLQRPTRLYTHHPSACCCRSIKGLSHDGFGGRCSAVSFSPCAENVLYNYDTGDDAPAKSMLQWYNSEGHKTNLMNPDYSKVGYGYFKCSDGANVQVCWCCCSSSHGMYTFAAST